LLELEENKALALKRALDEGLESPLMKEFDLEENLRHLQQNSSKLPQP
jgi:antitoxin ParD1/3/4